MLNKLMRRQEGLALSNSKGFTLLELLIVIVIIGILAVIIVPGLASGPQRARDADRKADLRSVQNALEAYYNDNSNYPTDLADLHDGTAPNGETYLPNDDALSDQQGTAYTYTEGPAGCDNSATDCTTYSLNATWEGNAPSGYPLTQQSS